MCHWTLLVVLLWTLAGVSSAEEVYRIPSALSAHHYDVTLLPILKANPRLCGHVWITMTTTLPTSLVVAHVSNLDLFEVNVFAGHDSDYNRDQKHVVEQHCFVGNASVRHAGGNKRTDPNDLAIGAETNDASEVLTIALREPMMPGKIYRVGISYVAPVYQGENKGFFRLKYTRNEDDCCER